MAIAKRSAEGVEVLMSSNDLEILMELLEDQIKRLPDTQTCPNCNFMNDHDAMCPYFDNQKLSQLKAKVKYLHRDLYQGTYEAYVSNHSTKMG